MRHMLAFVLALLFASPIFAADIYLDYEGGNDTAAGDTFAARRKTPVRSIGYTTGDTTADTLTLTAHGFTTGDRVSGTTTLTQPSGIGYPCYVRVIDANTCQFHPTRADALANTNRYNLTSVGSGTRTVYRIHDVGDRYKIMGSPSPVSIGTASWTNLAPTVTVGYAAVKEVDRCDTAWTSLGGANVVCAASTTRKEGANSASMAVGASFTTGAAAYKALAGATDYSNFMGISFQFRSNVASIAAGALRVSLCSDALGATPVDTFDLPAITGANAWVPLRIEKGSALGNSIQSVALYVMSDFGAATCLIDNVVATADPLAAEAIGHTSLIGKNTSGETWYCLRSITVSGSTTTMILECGPNSSAATTSRGYRGTTESVTSYRRETIKSDMASTAMYTAPAGSCTFSFGWDRTGMTAQSAESWFDGQIGTGYVFDVDGMDSVTFDGVLGAVRYGTGLSFDVSGTALASTFVNSGAMHLNCCASYGMNTNLSDGANISTVYAFSNGVSGVNGSLGANGAGFVNGAVVASCNVDKGVDSLGSTASTVPSLVITSVTADNNGGIGLEVSGSTLFTGSVNARYNGAQGIYVGTGNNYGIYYCFFEGAVDAKSNTGTNISLGGAIAPTRKIRFLSTVDVSNGAGIGIAWTDMTVPTEFFGLVTATGCASYPVYFNVGKAKFYGGLRATRSNNSNVTIFANDAYAEVYGGYSTGSSGLGLVGGGAINLRAQSIFRFYNFTVGEATIIYDPSSYWTTSDVEVSFSRYGGTDGDSRTYLHGATIRSESDGSNGLRWKMSVTSTNARNQYFPARVLVGTVSLEAGALATVSLRMQRSSATTFRGRLFCVTGGVGLSTDASSLTSASAGVWESVSVSFTPTVAGPVSVYAEAYDGTGTSDYVLFDDLTVTQNGATRTYDLNDQELGSGEPGSEVGASRGINPIGRRR